LNYGKVLIGNAQQAALVAILPDNGHLSSFSGSSNYV